MLYWFMMNVFIGLVVFLILAVVVAIIFLRTRALEIARLTCEAQLGLYCLTLIVGSAYDIACEIERNSALASKVGSCIFLLLICFAPAAVFYGVTLAVIYGRYNVHSVYVGLATASWCTVAITVVFLLTARHEVGLL
jgi:hypothetical protein